MDNVNSQFNTNLYSDMAILLLDMENGAAHQKIAQDIAALGCGFEHQQPKQVAMEVLGKYADKRPDTYPSFHYS